MKPSLKEMVDLIKELNEANKGFHALKAKWDVSPLTSDEVDKMQEFGKKASDLNKKRKELLPLFTPEEIEEMRKMFSQ